MAKGKGTGHVRSFGPAYPRLCPAPNDTMEQARGRYRKEMDGFKASLDELKKEIAELRELIVANSKTD